MVLFLNKATLRVIIIVDYYYNLCASRQYGDEHYRDGADFERAGAATCLAMIGGFDRRDLASPRLFAFNLKKRSARLTVCPNGE